MRGSHHTSFREIRGQQDWVISRDYTGWNFRNAMFLGDFEILSNKAPTNLAESQKTKSKYPNDKNIRNCAFLKLQWKRHALHTLMEGTKDQSHIFFTEKQPLASKYLTGHLCCPEGLNTVQNLDQADVCQTLSKIYYIPQIAFKEHDQITKHSEE